METKEKRNDEKKLTEEVQKVSCCGTQGSHKIMPDCCNGIGKADDHRSMMNKCMKGCRWFPFVPVVFGIAFLVLGYFLNPEIIRILWMIAAGFVILMGILGLLMMSKMKQICC
jgi:putative exporter of polyketide antibiotics